MLLKSINNDRSKRFRAFSIDLNKAQMEQEINLNLVYSLFKNAIFEAQNYLNSLTEGAKNLC